MSDIKDKVKDAAHTVADAAEAAGHKIAEGASAATAYVKEKAGIGCDATGPGEGVAGVKEHMSVYASCGKKVGVVDHVEGGAIKLTKSDSPDGQHHFIPAAWVGRVHEGHVHLTKNSVETEGGWMSDAAACAACAG
jgi:hypothetical protein